MTDKALRWCSVGKNPLPKHIALGHITSASVNCLDLVLIGLSPISGEEDIFKVFLLLYARLKVHKRKKRWKVEKVWG